MNTTPPTAEYFGASRAHRFAVTACRIVLGLVFLTMGLNGFLNFIPQAGTMPVQAGAFLGALVATGYMIALVSGVQVLVGALFLSNRFVPLALAVDAPVVVNIVAFHIFLAISGLPIAVVVSLLYLYLVWAYRRVYRSMLAVRVEPFGANPVG